MLQPGTVYVLGAGTSAGLVPFTGGTLAFVRQRYTEIGIYAADSLPSPLRDRVVIGPMVEAWKRGEWQLDDFLVEKIPFSTLELLAQKVWSPRLHGIAPPQYSLLQRVAGPAVFFSFNLDGLAKSYLQYENLVLEPHGTVDRLWTESPEFEELMNWSLDARLPRVARKLLPGPEPPQITRTRPYLEARTYLRTTPAMVVIGYSFGRFRGKMDDSESFEYLLDALGKRHCPIFVVDPRADLYANSLEERLRCRRVIPMQLRWDDFSTVVTTLIKPHTGLAALLDDRGLDMVIAAYKRRLMDTRMNGPSVDGLIMASKDS
jgi:hypothetical protein